MPKAEWECLYFHEPGHGISGSRAKRRSEERKPKGMGLIKSVQPRGLEVSQKEEPDQCFEPFIFDGIVSLTGKLGDERPVRILRDTGGSRSLLLSDVLPLSKDSSCWASILVQGFEMGYVSAPLHHVHVRSKLVSGVFVVAARPSFPIKGIDFIMGNDIAGGKVRPVPEVIDVPESKVDELVEICPNVFSSSVLTRAQSRRMQEGLDLGNTMLASILAGDEEDTVNPKEAPVVEKATRKEDTSMMAALKLPLTREALVLAQKSDNSLARCFSSVTTEEELENPYFLEGEVLMRMCVPHTVKSMSVTDDLTGEWSTVTQVCPQLSLAKPLSKRYFTSFFIKSLFVMVGGTCPPHHLKYGFCPHQF